MQLCEYVFSIGFHYMCPKMVFWGVLTVKMWKYCILTPKMHYPSWIRVSWCTACQNLFNGLSSRSVERFCVQRKKKKLSGNFGYIRSSNPWGYLTKCGLWGDMVDVITCVIYGDCRLRGCGCGERGKFAFSHWLDASPLQHVWYLRRLMVFCTGTIYRGISWPWRYWYRHIRIDDKTSMEISWVSHNTTSRYLLVPEVGVFDICLQILKPA